MPPTITIEKKFPSGALEASAIVDGYSVRRVYYGYTRREARRLFREHIKTKSNR